MAWNEPGNRHNQDPWRGGGDQRPPDLDEFLRKLQEKFGKIFGGNGRSSGPGGGGYGLFMLVLTVVLLIWAGSGVYRVEQAEQAVVLRFGEFHQIKTAGLHWSPPLVDQVLKINTQQVGSHAHQSSMLTQDQNIVDVQLEIQYLVADPKEYFLQINNPLDALRQAAESALRHVVGGTAMDQVITEGRHLVAQEVKARLQEYLERYESGLIITKVNVEDAQPPKEVKAAFDDVIKAREDETRLQNEAQAYANGVIPEARGFAKRQIEEALAHKGEVVSRATGEAERFSKLLAEYKKAPDVTRQRLYIETLEKVLNNTTKMMLDVKDGNNLIYLPMDKLITRDEAKKSVSNSNARSLNPDAVNVLQNPAGIQSRQRGEGR